MDLYTNASGWVCGKCGNWVQQGNPHYCPNNNYSITTATGESEEIKLLHMIIELLERIESKM